MKTVYTIFFLIATLGLGLKSYSQDFKAEKDSVFKSGYDNESEIVSYNKIYNFKDGAELVWKITADIPSAWQFAICDNNQCYPPGVDSATFLTISAGDSSPFQVYIYPNGTRGEGNLHVYIYDKNGDYNKGIEFTHSVRAYPVSMLENSLAQIKMYPSPVKNYLSIKFPSKGRHQIEIYNILGRRLMTKTIDNSDFMKLDFSSLQKGMYVIMYKDPNGKITTKTISKE